METAEARGAERCARERGAGSYHIETWGCQMNVHDSEKVAGGLEQAGYVRAAGRDDADVILLNTCSIREKAVEKVFSELGRIKRVKDRNPDVVIGVCGCVGQQEGARIFERAPYVDLVVGPRATGGLPATIERIRAGDPQARHSVDTEYRRDSIDFPFDEIRRDGDSPAKAYVTIIEGCNHRCTYCIVPTTRGREVCREMGSILEEVRRLVDGGTIEIEFLGQTVNAYRDAAGNTLAELLVATAAVDGVRRIRFTTSHPAQMTPRLIDAMADARPALCPYLHLPPQSGSTRVLRAMRRGYDRERYLATIEAIRARIPEMLFGGDVIVGFPSESDDEFRETLSLLDEVVYDTLYSFAYSPRPGTAALTLADTVPAGVAQARLAELQHRQQEIQRARMARWIGRTVEVLVEGRSKRDPSKWTGRTGEYRVVHFAGPSSPGRLERIEIVESSPYSLQGRLPEPAGLTGRAGRI